MRVDLVRVDLVRVDLVRVGLVRGSLMSHSQAFAVFITCTTEISV